tara:strand:- start:261 stop:671 length:411 start_codon:yes stop_codon:yes gene_type:complete
MVIGKIGSYLALGLVGAFLLNTLIRPQSALGTGAALQETGIGIASIGAGIGESLRSIGEGSAKLFNPLFTLKDLIESTGVAGAANSSAAAQSQGDTQNMVNTGSNTITWSSGSSARVPGLSAAAKSFYRSRGVSVN